ncbi:MAG: 4-(cytidine 5'-diphospho)-2-C-methyl-D-erythritol kinase [Gammaproteobacteria bacterium]|nr:4-(cytidine 5'-diphospho)-2-C-methyl-D-erythritol kinase [Gammaproteobacteria bacterium]
MQWWPAPAKINLFLHITGRRDDGYHELQTIFQFLEFSDYLSFAVRRDRAIASGNSVPAIDSHEDLAVRAAQLLQARANVNRGVDIHLDKRIPIGGGLGGGSSDAATTLLALNELWDVGWSVDQLAQLAIQLGADVPVFVGGHAAWAEGVGELLTPVSPPQRWYLILAPPVRVSTAAVFAHPELTRHSTPITIRDFHAGQVRNDLETVVCGLYPEVGEALGWLSKFGSARMTGSGGCVFLPVDSEADGLSILAQRPDGCHGFVTKGTNTHPMVSA